MTHAEGGIAAKIDAAAERLAGAEKVLLTCHRGPDGDSVGSLVALASLLRERGIEATLYCPDLVPRYLKWLPHTRTFVQKLKKTARYQATVVVDTGDPKLLGDDFPPPEVTGELIVLDHHRSGVAFGDLFVCDPDAASVGVLVARLARRLGWSISPDAAQGLYVSIVSDTGSFRYGNTNGEVLRLAADLVEHCGVDPWAISERMSEQGTLARYHLLAAVLQNLELCCDGAVAVMVITDEMVKGAKASWEDTEGMVNYARAIRGVECGVLITPAKRGGTRVSLRSKGHRIDAGAICQALGGGGHIGAAGCTLATDLPTARTQIEAALAAELAKSTPP